MARLQITPADVKSMKLVKPGWYLTKVVKYTYELNKAKDAYNHVYEMVGAEGDANGVPIKVWMSEKSAKFHIPFIKACGGTVTEETGIEFEMEAAVGMTVRAQWDTQTQEGQRPQNAITDYAPASNVTGTAKASQATPNIDEL